MASYYIDIIDTVSSLDSLVFKDASASGINLKWNGGDTKDGLSIVSSQLDFDMLSEHAEDAEYIDFFTGDEHRFKVLVKNQENDAVLWQGYILPDLYSEPYNNGCFFVQFTAVDCLGRLKGKFLPADYYSQEKSVIDIISKCLSLTGLQLDMYFAPAIENFSNKDYNTIYLDTANFVDKGTNQDAYTILDDLLKAMLCVCYQCDNRWYVEGMNMRHQRKLTYKTYDYTGVYVNDYEYTRLLKSIRPLMTPTITVIPPYHNIVITETNTAPALPDSAVKEAVDGWAIVTGVKGELYSSAWMNNGTEPRCIAPDYNVQVYHPGWLSGDYGTSYPDSSNYIALREKLYFAQNDKVSISLEFKIVQDGDTAPDLSLWKNCFKYEVVFNDAVLFSNFGGLVEDRENVIFDNGGTAKVELESIMAVEGLMTLKIYEPFGRINDNKIEAVEITAASVSIIDFVDTVVETDLINGEFTVDKDYDLTICDSKTGFGNTFRLAKLKEQTASYDAITVPVLYTFDFNGKHYAVVELDGANLIKQNIFEVYANIGISPIVFFAKINILNVYFNFNYGTGVAGEQMVVQTLGVFSGSEFIVRKYAVDDVVASRVAWTQWTDSVYKIENNSYAKTVANINRRIFDVAVEKLDMTVFNAVKFNDIILFNYVYDKEFHVLNCTSWNLDENTTTLTLGRSHYINDGSVNMPPLVVACDDIYIDEGVTGWNPWYSYLFPEENAVQLKAVASDPDGYIVSVKWEKVAGDYGDIVDNPDQLNTNVHNLTGDYYTYQITVTDNNGATATDTVNVIRKITCVMSLDQVDVVDNCGPIETSGYDWHYRRKQFKVTLSPNILPDTVLNVTGLIHLYVDRTRWDYVNWELWKGNGVSSPVKIDGVKYTTTGTYDTKVNFNMISTDEIFIYLEVSGGTFPDCAPPHLYPGIAATAKLQTVVVAAGQAIITGLPVTGDIENS